jgi:hypothetical protein
MEDRGFVAWLTEYLNRLDETNPTGTRKYVKGPDGRLQIVDEMSPGMQGLFDAEIDMDTLGKKIASGALKMLPGESVQDALKRVTGEYKIPGADNAERARIEDSYFRSLTRDFDRNQQQELEAKKQELANRGIPLGSDLYDREIRNINDRYDRARLEARDQATRSGGDEWSRSFGIGMQAQERALNNMQLGYNMPIAIAQGAAGIGRGYQLPQFNPTPGVSVPNIDFGSYFGATQEAGLKNRELEQDMQKFVDSQKADMQKYLRSQGFTEDQAKKEAERWEKQFKEERRQFEETAKLERQKINKMGSGGGGGGAVSNLPNVSNNPVA